MKEEYSRAATLIAIFIVDLILLAGMCALLSWAFKWIDMYVAGG